MDNVCFRQIIYIVDRKFGNYVEDYNCVGCGGMQVRTLDCQSRESMFKSSCCLSKLGQFCSLHVAPVHTAV